MLNRLDQKLSKGLLLKQNQLDQKEKNNLLFSLIVRCFIMSKKSFLKIKEQIKSPI
jgi:hypothetical protein